MLNGTSSSVRFFSGGGGFKLSALAHVSHFLFVIFLGLCVCLPVCVHTQVCTSKTACYFSKAVSLKSLCGNSVGCAVLDSALKDLQRQN